MGKQYSKVKKGMVFWFDQKSYGGGYISENSLEVMERPIKVMSK